MNQEELKKKIKDIEDRLREHRLIHKLDEEPMTFTKMLKEPTELEAILYFYKSKLNG